MKDAVRIMLQIIWPPIAPIEGQHKFSKSRGWWVTLSILTIIPLTAILHHLIFYTQSCMLNPFGADYTPFVTFKWLSRDPSLPWAIVVMIIVYHIGNFNYWLRILVAPVFLSFLPLSIWIWDLPFTGRFICGHFHDDRVMIAAALPLRSKYFYLIGFVLWLIFITYLVQKLRKVEKNVAS
ncbi:hypothetical protein MYX76_16455 [Desulfobacterota bacterium AH_259_B03_O07]|nr:hypothetical protein [Desulfobacterota bacterium AH_259_B03_O07]